MTEWCPGKWPPVSPAGWPLWWHLLSKAEWIKEKARRAASNHWQQICWSDAETCFLLDVRKHGMGIPRTLRVLPHCYCCPACGKSFRTRSGLGAHFRKLHQRCAAYRQYGGGNICQACGTDFFSEDRMLLHLRHARICRAKMASAVLRTDVVAPGVRSWKRTRETHFALCPPEKGKRLLLQSTDLQ